MKKLNQFITEYIIKKKLDHPINSETDTTNIGNTIQEIFNIKDEKIIDEINSFINEKCHKVNCQKIAKAASYIINPIYVYKY